MKAAIIGGGPAGSFCAIHLLRRARRLRRKIEVVIFDQKSFDRPGPGGCNLCAGVVTRSMIETLKEMNVPITARVIQRRIDGFVFVSEGGTVEIRGGPEDEFFSVFRGGGPVDSRESADESFDSFLMQHALELGAEHICESVRDISLAHESHEKVKVRYGGAGEYQADVVVGAFGVNSALTRKVEKMGFGYRAPDVIHVGQAEFSLPVKFIDETYRGMIKVFSLDFPGAEAVKFAALTPKRGYITASLIGSNIGEEEIQRVFEDPRILSHFPPGWVLPPRHCICFPGLPLRHAEMPFADRFVIVGDAHVSRFYKNGIGSAFNTALWAAETILEHGIREKDFRRHYYQKCRRFYYADNMLGRNLFRINEVITKNSFLAPMQIRFVRGSNRGVLEKKGVFVRMLWSLFTGERQYGEIIMRAFSFKR